MKVADLITALQGMPQDAEVVVWVEDAQMGDGWYEHVDKVSAENMRKRYDSQADDGAQWQTPGDEAKVVIS